ncbi:PAS domain S-box-containing protein [Syntrophus gentianae]|uniref:PAS domain S-box-containing protein n=1 Tax=Syntrophus gentianae TaxID=43775 RepID=A0A1H7V5P5_9BACT|nr:sigma 54-interacting transcriptional regulator [Syntrophus gentianae]SEM04582.1 PAS domain S-box-containing protein [Syntrophus gentianae]
MNKDKDKESQTQIILDSITDGVFTVDSEWKITSFNRAAESITGIPKEKALGRQCREVFRASICEDSCSLRHTVDTGQPVVNQSIFIENAKGERVPISISTALLKNKKQQVVGGVETFRDLSLVEDLRKELYNRQSFHDIISKNKEMHRLFHIVEQLSDSDATVILSGESGTGKELFAKAIHSVSSRKDGPMITINCGAVPDNLLESELFGYKAGAFTDAKKDKPGRITLAHGGTLFLDEIGDISPAMQVRLLRVLQEKVFEPLGGTKSEKVDVRIIAATNKDLEKLVKEGAFRTDFYYRINVVKLFLPPLRDRKEDIPLLAEYFISKFNRHKGKDIQGIQPEAMAILMSHDYPGNIRELENIIEYAMVVCKNGLIDSKHLPDSLARGSGNENHDALSPKQISLKGQEKDFIYNALAENNWNRKRTAARLGMHPATLWRKIKRLNIELPKQDGRYK